MSNRKWSSTTQTGNGLYWGCWVVTNIDTMRVAVFTNHHALQNATIKCAMEGHLYHVDVVIFDGELPSPANIHHAIKQVKDTHLTHDKLEYFNWLKGVRDGRLYERQTINPTATLADRLAQVYTTDKRERYGEDY